MSALTTIKDLAFRYAARKYINERYGEYGIMTKLEIDTHNKTIHAELELKGEAQPIVVDINGYELVQSSGQTLLRFTKVTASREWINTALQQLGNGKEFQIPDFLRILL